MLNNKKLAFIGAGQMGGALMKGILEAKVIDPTQVILSDVNKEKLRQAQKDFKVDIAENNIEAVNKADIVFLAVKPQQLESVLSEIKDFIRQEQTIISIAAGVSTKSIRRKINKDVSVVRVMPNSPALVGKGISVISAGEFVAQDSIDIAAKLFASVGEVVFLNEELQNQAMALSGCGPAYFYYFVENLTKAGVESGLDPETALTLVVETLIGAGAMLKETRKSPAVLREMVSSPGGTTLAALGVFGENDFSGGILKAVEAAIKRAEELEIV